MLETSAAATRPHVAGPAMSFRCDRSYRNGPGPALSVSLPKDVTMHEVDVTTAWFDNLLPDNDEVRAR